MKMKNKIISNRMCFANKGNLSSIKRIGCVSVGFFVGLCFVFWQATPADAQSESHYLNDDAARSEIRSVTVESWDRDYSGSGYGWRVFTNYDDKAKKTQQLPPYAPSASSLKSEREVKLLKGTPIYLRENYGYNESRVLGVRFAFTFPGDNVVSIAPALADHYMVERVRHYLSESILAAGGQEQKSCYKDKNLSILRNSKRTMVVECVNGVILPGIVEKISVWVMGRGDDYNLEAWVEDWGGDLYVLKMGSVNFIGWRPLSVVIPKIIKQESKTFPQTKNLVLRKFKLRANQKARGGDPVYIFFDELRILSRDLQHGVFDGAQLDFDSVDCERKNKLYRSLRENSRVPDQWPKLVNCSGAGGGANVPPAGN